MSVNKVILIGNVSKDPEIRYFDNNVAVANFTLATTERSRTGRDGQTIPERTEWHNLVVWRGLAQVVEKYVKKGTQIYVEGRIRTRSYDDKDNIKRYVTEIFVDNLQLLGRKGDGAATGQYETSAGSVGQPAAQSPAPAYGAPIMPASGSSFDASTPTEAFFGDGEENDLPF